MCTRAMVDLDCQSMTMIGMVVLVLVLQSGRTFVVMHLTSTPLVHLTKLTPSKPRPATGTGATCWYAPLTAHVRHTHCGV